jgi:hypothetical protein
MAIGTIRFHQAEKFIPKSQLTVIYRQTLSVHKHAEERRIEQIIRNSETRSTRTLSQI